MPTRVGPERQDVPQPLRPADGRLDAPHSADDAAADALFGVSLQYSRGLNAIERGR